MYQAMTIRTTVISNAWRLRCFLHWVSIFSTPFLIESRESCKNFARRLMRIRIIQIWSSFNISAWIKSNLPDFWMVSFFLLTLSFAFQNLLLAQKVLFEIWRTLNFLYNFSQWSIETVFRNSHFIAIFFVGISDFSGFFF